jgi:hypothetical protein
MSALTLPLTLALAFALAFGRRKRRQHGVTRSHLEGIELQGERRQSQAKVAQFPGPRVFTVVHPQPRP